MSSTKSSRVNPKYKKRYRVGNWQAYERGLRARGDVTVWFAEEARNTWTPPPTHCRGGQQRYSNLAILTAVTLRMLFHLPLRQTEGFVASLIRLMGLDLHAPDHTTISRRNRDVLVPVLRRDDDGPIHLIVDSTGLKIYGAGEWCSQAQEGRFRGGMSSSPGGLLPRGPHQNRTRRLPPSGSSVDVTRGAVPQMRTRIRGVGRG